MIGSASIFSYIFAIDYTNYTIALQNNNINTMDIETCSNPYCIFYDPDICTITAVSTHCNNILSYDYMYYVFSNNQTEIANWAYHKVNATNNTFPCLINYICNAFILTTDPLPDPPNFFNFFSEWHFLVIFLCALFFSISIFCCINLIGIIRKEKLIRQIEGQRLLQSNHVIYSCAL